MGTATRSKNDRINLRLKHEAKLKLERAASFEGKTVSKFILSSALVRAEKTIREHEFMNLNAQDSLAFFNALSTPVQFNEKLSTALKEHARRVTVK